MRPAEDAAWSGPARGHRRHAQPFGRVRGRLQRPVLAVDNGTGDQVNRKGALTGGYHDQKGSRLEAIKVVKKAQAALQLLQETQAGLQAKLDSTWPRPYPGGLGLARSG